MLGRVEDLGAGVQGPSRAVEGVVGPALVAERHVLGTAAAVVERFASQPHDVNRDDGLSLEAAQCDPTWNRPSCLRSDPSTGRPRGLLSQLPVTG